MAIVFQCTRCSHTLRVPEDVAGKRIKCPQCHEVLRIPDTARPKAADASPGDGRDSRQADGAESLFQLKTPDGNLYGPVPQGEMDRWLTEGRITAQCELLDQDGRHWRWASEVYPQLAAAAAPLPPPPAGTAPFAPVTVAPVVTTPVAQSPVWSNSENAAQGPRPQGWTEAAPPPFRARTYPAMNLTSKFYRLLGWLLIFAAGIAAFFYAVIVVGGSIVAEEMEGVQLAVYLGLSLLGLLGGAICVAALVITLWFASEAIKCLVDIEDNSHRCSFFLQNLHRRERAE